MIANGLHISNSQRHISNSIAKSYSFGMRGDEKRRTRSARLRKLQERVSYEAMGRKIGVNPTYLRQIGREVIGKGRKTPRSLSDNYASRLEAALNLDDGWFDKPTYGHEDVPQPSLGNLTTVAEAKSHYSVSDSGTNRDNTDQEWQRLSQILSLENKRAVIPLLKKLVAEPGNAAQLQAEHRATEDAALIEAASASDTETKQAPTRNYADNS